MAFALDWPGWSRGAKTAEVALETLESYRERYRPIADLAGMPASSTRPGPRGRRGEGRYRVDRFLGHLVLAMRRPSTGRWTMRSSIAQALAPAGGWAFFDGVAARVSPEMRKGPRGRRTRARRDHPPRLPRREPGLREAGRIAMPDDAHLTAGGMRSIATTMCRDPRLQRRRGREACGPGRCRS